jgi:hypothetical protein
MLPSACSFIVDSLAFSTNPTDNKERQETQTQKHKNMEINGNTTNKHKLETA